MNYLTGIAIASIFFVSVTVLIVLVYNTIEYFTTKKNK